MLVHPHGGRDLRPLRLTGAALAAERRRAVELPKLRVSSREKGDLVMLGIGGFTPLDGFMTHADWEGVCERYRTASGLFWPIPITLSSEKAISAGSEVSLVDETGPLATMRVTECYRIDKQRECQAVFRTADPAHPGVKMVMEQPEYNLAGPVKVLSDGGFKAKYGALFMTPAETRAEFERRGWRTVVGFQTRNPIHRAHEYLQKCALEIVDGLLVHPLVGATKADDVPPDVRMRCYEALFAGYYPKDRAMVSVFPAAMRYAGPKEAIWHAICRKNYGCTHFIVGRDHAGVGDYYGTYEAQEIFERFEPGELGITPLMFEHSFWCERCEGMASPKTCPHGEEDRVSLSGTKVREMLRNGERPPREFSRPEVADILIEAMRG
jgi:sulfate adenylyltransferase